MSFLAELWLFLRVRKKYWLMPMLLVMLLLGGLLVLAQGSAVAPFLSPSRPRLQRHHGAPARPQAPPHGLEGRPTPIMLSRVTRA